MAPDSKSVASLTIDEVKRLHEDFKEWPYIIRTIDFFFQRQNIVDARLYLRQMQEVANLLAIGEADSKL